MLSLSNHAGQQREIGLGPCDHAVFNLPLTHTDHSLSTPGRKAPLTYVASIKYEFSCLSMIIKVLSLFLPTFKFARTFQSKRNSPFKLLKDICRIFAFILMSL